MSRTLLKAEVVPAPLYPLLVDEWGGRAMRCRVNYPHGFHLNQRES